MTRPSSIRTLVLYADRWATLSYCDDWKRAFEASPEFAADTQNLCKPDSTKNIARHVREYDLIVLLHSTYTNSLQNIRHVQPLLPALNRRSGRLLSFVDNEVNLPGDYLGDKIAFLRDARADFVATQLPLKAGRYLYADLPNTRVLPVPHALNPERFRPVIPQTDRPIDIGVRSYEYFVLMGDIERNQIIDYCAKTKFTPPLRTDIMTAESGRLTPNDWAAFLNRCKATVATEAGTYYLERDDATMKRIVKYLEEKQGGGQAAYNRIRRHPLRRWLPEPLRRGIRALLGRMPTEQTYKQMTRFSNELTAFDDIFNRFYKDYPHPVSGKCISSRHFDAAGTKTLQIMFPGEYNGILKADVHYLSLAKDFSNIADVLTRFRDKSYCARMVDETYDYVLSEHTHAHRLRELRKQLDAS